ncbi:protein-disulfide reductase DsbD family protein [Aureibaculum sp. 2210JD6-5]|uniref:protein-disulfide reductase DsbD domain-containing protein n=1 Tax=Aureibaculum sp. 2210JD6-5 TaxID=3103957 RepID=UPI002AAC8384|nr:protein-disulfide reductase DsbD domain-containing protein [Aureibaculum sp. 2210JD6-5]MDY7396947.1 protein-disulfide reductase DsbD family protein [Aureibaculum sp. 2210JD6-5]
MKKLYILFLVVSLTSSVIQAQIVDPIKWSTSVKKISDSDYELITTATIDSGWHLYSQTVPEDGPIPTTFTFKSDESYAKKGNTKEEEGHTVQDPVFDMEIKYFENKATFKQRVKILKPIDKIIGEVEFMVCDDTRCLPPTTVDLEFSLN